MTQLKQKQQTDSPRTQSMSRMFNTFKKLTYRAERIKQQILAEIEEDWIFNDLTAKIQSYSF